ncbi:MAG: DCC1-like thiol-disulfide oxidoreductase family protein [Pseudomonadota bacterium]
MISVYYDGECPFCTQYVRMVRLQRTSEVRLIDLREDEALRARFEAEGYDLDGGMVVDDRGARYSGDKAVSYMAALSTPSDAFNRLNRWIFSQGALAAALYPVMRAGRWVALFLLNRPLISDAEDTSRFRREIFATFFAFFSIFHVFNYAFEYRIFPPSWDTLALGVTALALLFRPSSARLLFALMLISTVSTVLQAPVQSNHTIVRAAALLGYWMSFFTAMARNDHFDKVFERFAPAGCAALLIMYFYGVFHKINWDFLNPVTSCATTLWREMPWPLSALQGPFIDYSAIYGTFVVEGLIAGALLFRATRHLGIAAGIAFHLLLSLSGYAMYISFTTLSIALHTCFLSEGAARSILSAPIVQAVRTKLEEPIYKASVLALCLGLVSLAHSGSYTLTTLATFPFILPFCWAVLRYGGERSELNETPKRHALPAIGMIVGALFLANGAMPYLGLKTAQSINMFANLRLEAGESNHLVFSGDHRPFGYLDDIVTLPKSGTHRVYYDVLVWAKNNPEATVTFERNGTLYEEQNAASLKQDIDRILFPAWVNKWFHFQPVELASPEPCGV